MVFIQFLNPSTTDFCGQIKEVSEYLPVEILVDIDKEHRVLEEAAGSLVTLIENWCKNDTKEIRNDIQSLMEFFIKFMVDYHTKKEEDILFSAFEKLQLPRNKGPLYYYELEHKQHLSRAHEILDFLNKPSLTEELKKSVAEKAALYCAEIWEHIDKEDSVLLVEVRERIRGKLLQELNEQYLKYQPTKDSMTDLLEVGKKIIAKYKPVHTLPNVYRGDGCMSCRFYGDGCSGIEHEWWSEHEWEDFFARNDRD